MNKLYCLIIMLLACRICVGQNLVPNSSFELKDSCPTTFNQVSLATGWFATSNSPDYFDTCVSAPFVSIPFNWFGYHYPASGNAYAGFYAKDINIVYRECLGTALISPLQIGTKYFVSLKVALANWSGQLYPSYCGVNKIGALFSSINYSYVNPVPINNYAQVYTTNIITDTLWTRITGSFIADSSYSFINIGNFFDDFHTDSIQIIGNQGIAYYYLDDVCCSTDSVYSYNYTYTGIKNVYQNNLSNCFPNPFSDKLNFQYQDNEQKELFLFDITGRNLLQKTFRNSTSINTEQLVKGIYLYEVRNKNGVIKKGKVVKD